MAFCNAFVAEFWITKIDKKKIVKDDDFYLQTGSSQNAASAKSAKRAASNISSFDGNYFAVRYLRCFLECKFQKACNICIIIYLFSEYDLSFYQLHHVKSNVLSLLFSKQNCS